MSWAKVCSTQGCAARPEPAHVFCVACELQGAGTCRLCGKGIRHHGSLCTRCVQERGTHTPQANAAADLAAYTHRTRLPVNGATG